MKHEYLIELLKQNKTVILPNIGAFSNNTNPQHPYLFNEFLKFNDGMIAKHISSKEGISMDAAGETINKFTHELKEILAAGKEVVIPGIGTLQTKDGKTILTHETNSATPPLAEKKLEPVVEKKPEPIIEKKPEPIVEKKIETINETLKPVQSDEPIIEKKPEPTIEKKPEPILEKKPEPILKKVIVPVVEKKVEPVIETLKPVQSDKPIVEKKAESKIETLKPVQSDEPKTKDKPKKKRKLVWIILLVLILGGGGTAGFLYKDELMKLIGMGTEEKTAEKKSEEKDKKTDKDNSDENKADQNKVTEEPIRDTTLSEIPVTEEIVEEPKEEIKVEQVVEENKTMPLTAENSTPGNYYIIVGCFQESQNAENMIAKISSAGMTPTNVGTFNGLAHIAAGSASDLQGAIQQTTTIRSTFSKAWILKR